MAESDVHTVATAADNPNRTERLHDVTAKLHPMTGGLHAKGVNTAPQPVNTDNRVPLACANALLPME
jgi:hypothetical protein